MMSTKTVSALIMVGTAILLVPALIAGRPFIYWDTPTFFSWGHDVLAAISKPWPPLSAFPAHRGLWAADNMPGAWDRITPQQFQLVLTSIGARSKFYAVPLYALGSTLTLWAPAIVQAGLAAWLLWVASTAVLQGGRPLAYLQLLALLTVATTAPFFVAFLMPDVFAAFGLLALALLLSLHDQLSRSARVGCAVLLAVAVLVHLSILPTVVVLLAVTVVMARLLAPVLSVWRGAALAVIALACAGAAGSASDAAMRAIFGEAVRAPPFMEGRVIVDGPGQQFLRETCAKQAFAACRWKDRKVWNTDDIIWPDVTWHGLPLITDPAERRRFLDEQGTVVLGALEHHPFAQLWASSRNAVKQLLTINIAQDVGASLSGLLNAHTDRTMRIRQIVPDLGPCLGEQARACDDSGALRVLLPLQWAVVLGGLAVLGWCIVAWIRPSEGSAAALDRQRVALFALIIVGGVILNGVLCGAVSGPWGRYQARVVWLLPMAAMLLLQHSRWTKRIRGRIHQREEVGVGWPGRGVVMTAGLAEGGRYAVVFRTHIWDDYVARQYRRLCARVGGGDVFILVDETSGPVPISEGTVVSHTQESVKALGLANAGRGNMLWYNGDYPLYFFYHHYPNYKYYVMIEYDVAVHEDIDPMIAHVAREGIGFVGLTKGESVAEWPFTASCLDVYALADIKKSLICLAIFSRDAVRALFEQRLSLSREFREGRLERWPYCEGFIPTELALRGFKLAELSDLGSTDLYDWRPAFAETDLAELRQHTFVHPVLDPHRYVQATLRSAWSTTDALDPRSDLMRRLRRVPLSVNGAPLAAALRRRVAESARTRIARAASLIGARRQAR